jgi:hypothetical protein
LSSPFEVVAQPQSVAFEILSQRRIVGPTLCQRLLHTRERLLNQTPKLDGRVRVMRCRCAERLPTIIEVMRMGLE